MLFVLISCFSFILLSNSISRNPLPLRKTEMKLLFSPCFWVQFSSFLVSWFGKCRLSFSAHQVPVKMSLKKVKVVEEEKMSLLDLPELALDCILERLSPAGLCSMAGVCTSLRERCRDDRLWEKHMKQKWGRVIGDAACRAWQWHIALQRRPSLSNQSKQKGLFQSLCPWPFSFMRQKLNSSSSSSTPRSSSPVCSIMTWYLSLESGKFWFPAQVYNREHGHAGFMLSCYDAQLCYDSQTDTFLARYLPHGLRTIEENVPWHRLRAPPVDTPADVLHLSDCLDDLKPGDHIEIQWRRNKEFPYGWWYGIVGHLESCDGNESHCRCQNSDTAILEFSQYMPGSRWRSTVINRKDHREEGNEEDGFYGGIRKIYKEEEVSMWKCLRPSQVLE